MEKNKRIKILGIDPGSRTTGFAILEEENGKYRAEICDVIRMAKMDDHNDRLQFIFDEITKLGRPQAAAILAITNQKIPVSEYYPKAVKKAITGNGNASKEQVAFMLERLMTLPDRKLKDDATDALAVAWCHHTKTGHIPANQMKKKMHQNNSKNSWAAFVDANPDRVKKH